MSDLEELCGTRFGRAAHMRLGKKACRACRDAANAYEREQRRIAREKPRPEPRPRPVYRRVEAADVVGLLPARPLVANDWRLKVYGALSPAVEQNRRPPRRVDQHRILALQGDVCLYCGIPIGTEISRVRKDRRGWTRTSTVVLRRNWDHFVPYSYIARNPQANWVLACHVCNLIKTARMFDTVEDARHAILPHRERRGYEPVRQVLARLAGAEA